MIVPHILFIFLTNAQIIKLFNDFAKNPTFVNPSCVGAWVDFRGGPTNDSLGSLDEKFVGKGPTYHDICLWQTLRFATLVRFRQRYITVDFLKRAIPKLRSKDFEDLSPK